MRFLVLLFTLLAAPASAQVVVKTGEHGAFTRLVLQFNGEPSVTFGRTEAGYELAIAEGNPAYDLTRVFQLIGRQRLKSIWADPSSGNLLLGIGCACHALMEVAANGLIVIDIHDGAAPTDSGFELSLNGSLLPPLGTSQTLRPRPRPSEPPASEYQWTAVEKNLVVPDSKVTAEEPLISSLQLLDLRQRLATSIDVAGATGIIELRQTEAFASKLEATEPERPLNLNIGPLPSLSDDGHPCLPEQDVAVSDWRQDGSPSEILARSRNGILEEFDRINQSELASAVRTYLYFGFGAEARNLIETFGLSSESADLLVAISLILDGLPVAQNPFADQTSCKGPVALWALAALPSEMKASNVDEDSVVQAFMALPAHLQTLLASDLSAKLIASGKLESAEIIAATLSRAAGPHEDSVALVETEIALAKDDLESAQHKVDAVQAHDNAKTVVLKAETAFRKKQSLGMSFLTEVEALYYVEANGPDGPKLSRALALTRALENDFENALSLAGHEPETARDVWGYLAEKGGDGTLLKIATQTTPTDRQIVASSDRAIILARLIDLGFPKLAEEWMDPSSTPREMQARLALSDHDGRRALDLLDAPERLPDSELRLEALAALNRHEDMASLLTATGQEDQALRVRRWMGKWDEAVGPETDPWSRLAQSATREVEAPPPPSLALSESVAAGTVEDMKDIGLLLDQTKLN